MINYFPFDTPRDNQLEISQEIVEAFKKYKYVILNAPTGIGKSAIAIAVGRYYIKNHLSTGLVSIVTSEKILQDQYTDDFTTLPEIVSVKGVGAYICPKDNMPVSEAECRILSIKRCKNSCDYKKMLKERKNKNLWITNYSISLTNKKFKDRKHDLFICDEMHKIESILLNSVTASFNVDFLHVIKNRLKKKHNPHLDFSIQVGKLFELFNKGKKLNDENAVQFYYELFSSVSNIYCDIYNKIANYVKEESKKIQSADNYTQDEMNVIKSLKYYSNTNIMIDTNIIVKYELLNKHAIKQEMKWILEISENEIVFKPVYANFLFEPLLGVLSNKFLFMSATAYCKSMFCKQFNVAESSVYEISLDSPFPVENRKVYVANCMSMSYTELQNNLKKMVMTVDDLLNLIRCRTVIHSGNYNIARYIESNSIHRSRIVAPKSGERELLIQRDFINKDDGVLISPSLIEGVSLNDDMCRVQIFVKVPYMSLADKRIKIRATKDSLWYQQETIFKLVQASGRGVRHKDDFCITFILDSAFSNLYNFSSGLFPVWFMNAIEYISPNDVKLKLQTFLKNKNL